MISIEAHRAAIGKYYSKARRLSNPSANTMNICFCQIYEDAVLKLTGYNYLTTYRFFSNHENVESMEKDLEFIVAMIETVFNVSFLKVLQLLVDGDIESNPGPTENIDVELNSLPIKKHLQKEVDQLKNEVLKAHPRKLI